MGNSTNRDANNLENINRTIVRSVSNAQAFLQMKQLEHMKQYFKVTFPDHLTEEEKCLDNAILVPRMVKVQTPSGDIIDVPLCTLTTMNRIDLKKVNVKASLEIKQMNPSEIVTCLKHKHNPTIELDITLESIETSENVQRIIQKFHI
jgi:hypothetical protein